MGALDVGEGMEYASAYASLPNGTVLMDQSEREELAKALKLSQTPLDEQATNAEEEEEEEEEEDDEEEEEDDEDEDKDDAEDFFHPATEKVWQQNAALCRNFDELKHLYIQSTQLNLRLQATCTTLRKEKEGLQKSLLSTSDDDAFRYMNSDQRHGKDQYDEPLHGHGDSVTLTEEKRILQLEAQNIELMRQLHLANLGSRPPDGHATGIRTSEQLRNIESRRSSERRELEGEVARLKEVLAQKDRQEEVAKALHAEEIQLKVSDVLRKARQDEDNHREIRRAFESEITELRALLTAVEQASSETELRHLNSVSELVQEKELLQEKVKKFQETCKLLDDSVREAEMEKLNLRSELEESHKRTKEALIKKEQAEMQAASLRAERDDMQKKLDALQGEMEELASLRKKDLLNHLLKAEEYKRKCDSTWRIQEDASKERGVFLGRKIQRLREKLRDAQNQTAKLSFECNQLLIQRRECEAQLCAIQKMRPAQVDDSVSMEQSMNKAKVISVELNQLAARQSRYLPFQSKTFE